MSKHPSRLVFLDGLRGLAAFYVMVGHARWLLWEGYATGYRLHPERYSTLGRLLVFALGIFRWGHEAVLFFFVLSGFVIHLRFARRALEDPQSTIVFWPYLRRRARRLYPPLLAALVITFVFDALGHHLRLPTAGTSTPYWMINQNVGHDHSLVTLLRNLVFIMVPVFGSDGPLWSLNYEWYFYLLYPPLFLVARRSSARATLVLMIASALGFSGIWPNNLVWLKGVFQLMIVWWFGALLAERFAGRFRISYRKLACLMLAFAAVPFWRWNPVARDIVIGLAFTGLIALCFAFEEGGCALSPLVRLRGLGEMSYTLYVTHFPLLVFMSGCLMASSGGPLPQHFGWMAGGAAISVVVAWVLHLAVERPFISR